METILFYISATGCGIVTLVGLAFFISCMWEKEPRASVISAIQFLLMLAVMVLLFYFRMSGIFKTSTGLFFLFVFIAAAAGAGVFIVRKSGQNLGALEGTSALVVGDVKRIDERDVLFARNRTLRPGSQEYKSYYALQPENENYDNNRRQRGGPLGHIGSIDRPNDRPNAAATLASLSIPLHLSQPDKYNPAPHPEFRGQQVELAAASATKRVKGYTQGVGANLVGICKINPLWIYSHRGEIFLENWEDWGQQIDLEHEYAVVFATEMDFELVGSAPHLPTTIASMSNYAQVAYIATQVAAFIANMGYSATANHIRHYDTLLVPLAVDAGLGEVGRLGYLMTKDYGPRVRLGAVTTDLPLIPDKPVDIGVVDFCQICKKCAHCCPSKSIPQDDRQTVNGTLRWKLNAETCFDYWGRVGTDCNICMRVCPWSHATTMPHQFIRELITRNHRARQIFSMMDDLFYGYKPKPKPAPEWARYDTV